MKSQRDSDVRVAGIEPWRENRWQVGCAEEPGELPALQTGHLGLQGQDGVRTGWRGEESVNSETTAVSGPQATPFW